MGHAPPEDDLGSDTSYLWRLSGMGMELFGSIAGAGLVGWLIDRAAGTGQRWLLVGLVVGMVGGGFNFIRRALAMNRLATEQYRQRRRRREALSKKATSGNGKGQVWFQRNQIDPDEINDEDRPLEFPPDFDDD